VGGGVIALRGRELRRWAIKVIDHHEWGLASGDAAVAVLLGLALVEGLAAAGLIAVVAAVGDPRARGPLALRGLAAGGRSSAAQPRSSSSPSPAPRRPRCLSPASRS
jgi:hypothetical protein